MKEGACWGGAFLRGRQYRGLMGRGLEDRAYTEGWDQGGESGGPCWGGALMRGGACIGGAYRGAGSIQGEAEPIWPHTRSTGNTACQRAVEPPVKWP